MILNIKEGGKYFNYSNLMLNLKEHYLILWKKINPTSFLPLIKGEDEGGVQYYD